MTNNLKAIGIVVAGLVVVVCFYMYIHREKKVQYTTINNYYDSTQTKLASPAPIIINNIPATSIDYPKTIDTPAVVRDYYSKNVQYAEYRDTNISISITDTTQKNSVVGRGIEYKILKPIAQTLAPLKRELYAGLSVYKGGFIPKVLIKDKKGKLYGGGYDVINKNIYLEMSLKLGK